LEVQETPVVSVPVVAPGNWMREPEPAPAPEPARFMSEEETENASEQILFAAATPRVATTVTVAAPSATDSEDFAQGLEPKIHSAPSSIGVEPVPFEEAMQAKPSPRDYAAEFVETQRAVQEPGEPVTQASTSLFAEPNEMPERDLDVPTFLRRLRF
jgi:cell division protein FtsZ